MKLLKISLLLVAAFTCSVQTMAQSAENIVSKHISAIGGEKVWKTLNSVKLAGVMNAQGMELPITLTQVHNKAMRMDLEIMGMSNYQIVTREAGWSYFPVQQMEQPEPMTQEQVKMAQSQLDIRDELVDYRTKGHKITYEGKEEIDGTEVYKLKLTRKEGSEKMMFFDTKNHYLLRETEQMEVEGQSMELVTSYSNFKKLPEGIVFPMTIETPQGPLTFTSVEINPKVDESIFLPSK